MNGIDKITQRITEEIEQAIGEIRAQAKEKADAITADYAARVQKESADILSRGKNAAAEREERLRSLAQMEAKKSMLGVKQEMLGRAYDMALDKLCALPADEYVALLARLAAQAARTGREKVILNAKDRDGLGRQVVEAANARRGEKGRLTLAEKAGAFAGGLIVTDGSVDTNCTFETLVRLQRAETAGEAAAILFQ